MPFALATVAASTSASPKNLRVSGSPPIVPMGLRITLETPPNADRTWPTTPWRCRWKRPHRRRPSCRRRGSARNWIQHWSPFPASVFGSESVLVEHENATNSRRSTSCSSPFRSTHPGTRNTGGVSQRRTERLIAGDVLSDGFVEPTCRIESACCALQMQ